MLRVHDPPPETPGAPADPRGPVGSAAPVVATPPDTRNLRAGLETVPPPRRADLAPAPQPIELALFTGELPDGRVETVSAPTRSHARALLKAVFGIRPRGRLPVGTLIRVGRAA
jgi:hypothetical protein